MQARGAIIVALVVSATGGGVFAACFDYADNCVLLATCCPDGTLDCLTKGDGGPDGGDADSGAPSCAGDPTTTPAIVRDDCGVFVSAGAAPGGTGSQEQPFATFAEAATVKPSRVFACAGTYTETSQVSFSGGVEVYGGFTGCSAAGWTWSGTMQAQIATVADKPGVVLGGGANRLENVSVTAPAATMSGGSSIAVIVNGGSLEMTNGALAAGDAQDGAVGASLAPDPTLDGATGANGVDACDLGRRDEHVCHGGQLHRRKRRRWRADREQHGPARGQRHRRPGRTRSNRHRHGGRQGGYW
jgi:hypothetical protein